MEMDKPGKIRLKTSSEHEFDIQMERRSKLKKDGISYIVDLLDNLDSNTEELLRLTRIIESERNKFKGN